MEAGAERLRKDGIKIRIVSAPSEGLFRSQSKEYQNSIIPTGAKVFGLTAGLPVNLEGLVGANGKVFGLESFGFSEMCIRDSPCTADMTEEEVKGAYEQETGNVIVKRFKKLNPVHTPGVLVKNHGPFAWGKDANDAVHNAVVMEQVAKMASIAFAANPHLTMNSLLIEKHFSPKHGPNAYYGQK